MSVGVPKPITPTRVRYIKLGAAGGWERECLDRGIARIGFGSGKHDQFALLTAGRWAEITAAYAKDGRDRGTATRFTNEVRLFFEDRGTIVWVTFIGERLYWGFLEGSAEQHPDGEGVFRRVRGGWCWTDVNGEPLTKDRLAGSLTKLAAYRGTSCDVDVSDYVVRRINGQKPPEVERALGATKEMKAAALGLMKLLEPRDFEVLVDLVFTTSGWRRIGVVGKTQKTLDLDLILPSTGQRAFVQVKARTTSAQLADYVGRIGDGPFDRMFYVFHSGEAATNDPRVTVIGPEELAELVLDAGLTSWLIRKVS